MSPAAISAPAFRSDSSEAALRPTTRTFSPWASSSCAALEVMLPLEPRSTYMVFLSGLREPPVCAWPLLRKSVRGIIHCPVFENDHAERSGLPRPDGGIRGGG